MGAGSVPMAFAGPDSKFRCEVDGCQFIGNSICSWPRYPFASDPSPGGCGKRYCPNHRHDISPLTFRTKRGVVKYENSCCIKCADEFESDFKLNFEMGKAQTCLHALVFLSFFGLIAVIAVFLY